MTKDDATENELGHLIRALGLFNRLDTKMQVSTILTLLEVARADIASEEISTADIQSRIGLLSGTGTRNVYYWADGHQDVRGAHEMISVAPDVNDRRRRSLRLTAKGRAFVRQLLKEVA